jgi:hypothetical protein
MDIINKIGYFDENFIPGQFEDDDYKLRLQYNDIGFYEDHSVVYRPSNSLWALKNEDTYSTRDYLLKKYNINDIDKTIKVKFDKSSNIDLSKYKRFDDRVRDKDDKDDKLEKVLSLPYNDIDEI